MLTWVNICGRLPQAEKDFIVEQIQPSGGKAKVVSTRSQEATHCDIQKEQEAQKRTQLMIEEFPFKRDINLVNRESEPQVQIVNPLPTGTNKATAQAAYVEIQRRKVEAPW